MDTTSKAPARVSERSVTTKAAYAAFLGVVLALFTFDNIRSLVLRGDLTGNIANAQSFAEPADESSSDEDGVTPDVVNNVAGTWSGPVTDSVAGDGTLMLTIHQKANATALKGTFTYMFPSVTKSGTLKGHEKNGTGMLDLIHKSRHHKRTCIAKAAITVPDATHMNATFMTTGGCGQSSTGTFMLTMP
jgi:hypothetical protein